jgi:glucose/arabinose dehydrogenase
MTILPRSLVSFISALALCSVPSAWTYAQPQSTSAPKSEPSASISDPALLPDQELGRRFMIKAEDLPPPKTGPIVASRALTIPYQGQMPRAPEGFAVTPFVTGLEHPRRLLVLPNGDVIVAEQRGGYLTLLRDEDGDGRAEWIQRHAEGFNQPYGLAWRDGHVLVADQDASGRYRTS